MTRPRDRASEQGLTLIELMIALLLLGVILSAGASALIQFSRIATDNERRVQGTAVANRLQEELQAIDWRDALVYEDELQALLDDGFPGLSADPEWRFEGQELVVLPGPDGAPRREAVPQARTLVTDNIDGNEYEVVRLVVWSDNQPSLKRFITVVRWNRYGETVEERFISERAPTALEAGDPELPRVIQFQVGPSPMLLDDEDRNAEPIQITVRFSDPVDSASLRFRSLQSAGESDVIQLVDRSLPLTAYINDTATTKPIAFRTTIPAGAYWFPNGTRNFDVRGLLGSDTFSGRTAMVFTGGSLNAGDVGDDPDGPEGPQEPEEPGVDDGLTPPDEDLAITNVALSITRACNDPNDRFAWDVVVTARVAGLTPEDYNVSATFTAGASTPSQAMEPVAPETFSPSGADFVLRLPQGQDHGFRPGNGTNDSVSTDFRIEASRRSDDASATASSPQNLTVRRQFQGSNVRTGCEQP